jgi:spermidine synthase
LKTRLSAAISGFCAMVAQLALTRELIVVSLGDELSVGLALFAWMAWAAAGSAAGGFFFRSRRPTPAFAAFLLILQGALAPASIALARAQGPLFGYLRGEAVPVEIVAVMALVTLGPLCFVHGFLFPALSALEDRPLMSGAAGRMFAWDTGGAVAGGLAFSFILVASTTPVTCAALAGGMSAAIGASWLQKRARLAVWSALAAAAVLSPLWAAPSENFLRSLSWGRPVADSVESGYGNITVIEDGGQRAFYSGGRVAGVTPDVAAGEYMAHVPLLAHPAPRSALFVGVDATTIREALEHGLDRVVWAELDPAMFALRRKHAPPQLAPVFDDPRVFPAAVDPRRLLSLTYERFDVIVISSAPPETIVLNRMFTREAFDLMKSRLTEHGVLAITVPFTENYMSEHEAALLAGTLMAAAPELRRGNAAPPGEKARAPFYFIIGQRPLLLLSRDGAPAPAPETAAARLTERGIVSGSFTADTAAFLFDPRRAEAALMQFSDDPMEHLTAADKTAAAARWLAARPGAAPNSDLSPNAVFLKNRLSAGMYKSMPAAAILDAVAAADTRRARTLSALVLLAFAALLAVASAKRPAARAAAARFTTASAGAASLVSVLAVVFLFQISFGVVYQYLGLVNAAYLGGSAAGAGAMSRARREDLRRGPAALASAAFCLCAATASLPSVYSAISSASPAAAAFILFPFAIVCGFCSGAIFPLAVERVRPARRRQDGAALETSAAGSLYFADLAGACAAALLAGSILIPTLGVFSALYAASILCLAACVASLSPTPADVVLG